ncbi:MAG: hypothetical protein N2C14_19855 [Planctomycetales bacterium]
MKHLGSSASKRVGVTAPLAWVVVGATAAGAYSVLSLLKSSPPFAYVPDIPVGLDAALSFSMALFISFRVNRAYERWWEARTLWGILVNASRNLAVKVRRLRTLSEEERRRARDLIVAFSLGLKDHLRDEARLSQLPGFENDDSEPAHLPSHVMSKFYAMLQQWRTGDDALDGVELLAFDAEARVFLEICGGCERIKNTLVSTSWRIITVQCIMLYLLTLPWGLVDDFGMWVVPITMIAAYIVIAAEVIARYVEEPFGLNEDHLDLDAITDAIDRSVTDELLSRD